MFPCLLQVHHGNKGLWSYWWGMGLGLQRTCRVNHRLQRRRAWSDQEWGNFCNLSALLSLLILFTILYYQVIVGLSSFGLKSVRFNLQIRTHFFIFCLCLIVWWPLLQQGYDSFLLKLKEATWVPHLFRVSVAQHEYNGTKRQRITVRSEAPVDYATESKYLLEAIMKLTVW